MRWRGRTGGQSGRCSKSVLSAVRERMAAKHSLAKYSLPVTLASTLTRLTLDEPFDEDKLRRSMDRLPKYGCCAFFPVRWPLVTRFPPVDLRPRAPVELCSKLNQRIAELRAQVQTDPSQSGLFGRPTHAEAPLLHALACTRKEIKCYVAGLQIVAWQMQSQLLRTPDALRQAATLTGQVSTRIKVGSRMPPPVLFPCHSLLMSTTSP